MTDTMKTALITAISTLVAALGAVGMTQYLDRKFTKADLQLDAFQRVSGWRFKLDEKQLKCNGDEFFAAINEAEVVFYDSPAVRAAIDQVRAGGANVNVHLTTALREMMSVLKIEPPLDDEDVLKPVAPSAERC